MVYYPQDGRSGPRAPMYSHRGGPASSMRRQDEAYYYPNQMRRDESYFYPIHMGRREEAYFNPGSIRRQDEAYFYPGQMGGREVTQYYPSEMRGRNYPPKRPQSSFERLPDHLNTIMGHMGTITQGVNMMRQIGSLLSMFKR